MESILHLLKAWKTNLFIFLNGHMQLGYTVGSLLVEVVAGWRYMYGVSVPISIIMGIGMWWLPASPRWILLCAIQGKGDMQDLRETAVSCLCRLRGEAIGDSAHHQVGEILSELSHLSEEKEATMGEMFQGKCLKALTIGAGLILFQQVSFAFHRLCFQLYNTMTVIMICIFTHFMQITGQPSVLYYAAKIFQVCLLDRARVVM